MSYCNFKKFINPVVGTIYEKEEKKHSFDQDELETLIGIAYVQATRQFAKDSETLVMTSVVDIVEGHSYYPIEPPKGFIARRIDRVNENKIHLTTDAEINLTSILLKECPKKDIPSALYIDFIVIPKSDCKRIPDAWCEQHYDGILSYILYQLTIQKNAIHYDLELARLHKQDYEDAVRTAKNERVNVKTDNPFFSEVMGLIGGCAPDSKEDCKVEPVEIEALLRSVYRSVVIEFALKSEELTHLVPIDVIKGERVYPLSPPSGFLSHKVIKVHENNLRFPTSSELNRDRIVLKECPMKDVADAWRVEIATYPEAYNCDFDKLKSFVSRHYNVILNGILARFTSQRSRYWYDLDLSKHYLSQYEEGITTLLLEADYREFKGHKFLSAAVGLIGGCKPEGVNCDEDNHERDALVREAYRATIRDFTQRTRTLRETITVDFIEGYRHYPIDAPTGYRLIEIEKVYSDAVKLPPLTEIGINSITLESCPDKDTISAIKVEISIAPTSNTCHVDEAYTDEHYTALLDGILYRLASQKSRYWYDLDLARSHQASYERLVKISQRETISRKVPCGTKGRIIAMFANEIMADDDKRERKESEILNLITMLLSDTIKDVALKSEAYQLDIGIDLLKSSKIYYPYLPDGFRLNKILGLLSDTHDVPDGTVIHEDYIELPCCPTVNADHAIVAKVSVIPSHDDCDYDEAFITKYYEAILSGIRWRLALQYNKQYASMQSYRIAKQDYEKLIRSTKRHLSTGRLSIKKRFFTNVH